MDSDTFKVRFCLSRDGELIDSETFDLEKQPPEELEQTLKYWSKKTFSIHYEILEEKE